MSHSERTGNPCTSERIDDDLAQVAALVCQAGGLAEIAIFDAVAALLDHDDAAAAQVVSADFQIDSLVRDIKKDCASLIELRKPAAEELGAVLASFQVAILVGQIGDCARCIAEQIPRVPRYQYRDALPLLRSAAAEASNLVRRALDSYASRDSLQARHVCMERARIDSLNEELLRELLGAIAETADANGAETLLVISYNLARICDCAMRIGKVVSSLNPGEPVPDQREIDLSAQEHA